MTQTACQYAIVRFAPFVETGEFANVGVLLLAPEANYFDFKLETRRHKRITAFFDGLEARQYKAAMQVVQAELQRAGALLGTQGFGQRQLVQDVFDEITRQRESIIRFSTPRVLLADNPKAKLQKLFDYYVQRDFVNREYSETVLERSIRDVLKTAHLQQLYQVRTVGEGTNKVRFPFVSKNGSGPQKAIKPLYPGQDQPTRIIEHGAGWAFRVQQLRSHRHLPDRVLFAVDGPKGSADANRTQAFDDAMHYLQDTGVDVVAADDRERVLDFAAS